VVAAEQPDVVHIQHLIHLSRGSSTAAKAGVPCVVTLSDFWARCSRVSSSGPTARTA
jgi:hypothetical protein